MAIVALLTYLHRSHYYSCHDFSHAFENYTCEQYTCEQYISRACS